MIGGVGKMQLLGTGEHRQYRLGIFRVGESGLVQPELSSFNMQVLIIYT